MSSTGRGAERAENDRYFTPYPLARELCRQLTYDGFLQKDASIDLLEPHAGAGSFVEAMRDTFKNASITANDIVEDRERWLSLGADETRAEDFTKLRGEGHFDGIIGNPPYSEAEKHCRFALDNVDPWYGVVAFLLPLGFLESKERNVQSKVHQVPFWKQHPATCVYVLAERPSFTGKGTDSNCYGWFVWQNRRVQYPTRLQVLSWK